MTPNEIFMTVRMSPKIADNASVKYSVYQMIDALNDVLNVIYNTLSTMNSDILLKNETVYLSNGTGDLPEDFLMIHTAKDASGNALTPCGKNKEPDEYTYRIEGTSILSANDTLGITYKPFFTEVEADSLDDDIDLPNWLKPLVKRAVISYLTDAADDVMQSLAGDIRQIVSGRSYTEVFTTGGSGASSWAEVI